MENLRSCNKYKERICTEEGESVFTVKREEIREFIQEQLRKGYIQLSKLSQMALVFFIEKKNGKKQMV